MKGNRINYLILGDGLLGSEIRNQTGWEYISRKKDSIDFNRIVTYEDYLHHPWLDMHIINCIANTDTYSNDKYNMLKTNYWAVMNLVDHCNLYNSKIIQISTDYVYAGNEPYAAEEDRPIPADNWYSYSKLLADEYIQARANKWLIIRTSFKPRPFPYEKGWIGQRGNFDYVDVISRIIVELIKGDARGIYNVGTGEKTMYDLASITRNVTPTTELPFTAPENITMNLNKTKKFLEERELEIIQNIRT